MRCNLLFFWMKSNVLSFFFMVVCFWWCNNCLPQVKSILLFTSSSFIVFISMTHFWILVLHDVKLNSFFSPYEYVVFSSTTRGKHYSFSTESLWCFCQNSTDDTYVRLFLDSRLSSLMCLFIFIQTLFLIFQDYFG